MKYVAITVAALAAVDQTKMDLAATVDQVILKNLESHYPATYPSAILHVSEAVANRIAELTPVSAETPKTEKKAKGKPEPEAEPQV